MASLNRVTLMGNLTKDPETRKIKSGQSVGDLRLAISEKYRNKAGEQIDSKCYVDVVVWGKQADACGEYLKKGSQLVVDGKLQLDEWEKDGQKRDKLRVRADTVQFVSANGGSAAPAEDCPF